ncbi:hypothetical protein BAY61_18330 [Prauserella marina]|uniref:Uncharacterized protein n=1 Tax=Prauserella marina TaxID=530584 RepID=A0A222VRV8_9PSEU|nr:DUF5994 family protein [Prauserella marina]ASR36634.1 hypothetical protein BAY61_18330 [Prauserella marina]PWV74048.1 hypothetical protein DES30_108222 [Prauserella marina]SDD61708.1 hypothetical protein SAMN05421630_110223 [Prauserella marina]
MTSSPHTLIATPSTSTVIEPPRHTLRLRLKPKAPTTGYVDGAWWPRSRDLAAELPALLAVLAIRPGRIERVTYNLTMWEPAARRLTIEGRTVRLEGFRSQHPDTVTVTGQGRQRLTLLVVAPETTPASAHDTLMTASQRDNVDSTDTLLALSRVTPVATLKNTGTELMEAATQRWEVDGGRVR